jgi:hypothetical protein
MSGAPRETTALIHECRPQGPRLRIGFDDLVRRLEAKESLLPNAYEEGYDRSIRGLIARMQPFPFDSVDSNLLSLNRILRGKMALWWQVHSVALADSTLRAWLPSSVSGDFSASGSDSEWTGLTESGLKVSEVAATD